MTQQALEGGLNRLFDVEEGVKFVEYPPNAMQFRELCYRYHASLRLPKSADACRDIEQYAIHGELPAHAHAIVRYIAAKLPDSFFEVFSPFEKQDLLNRLYKKGCEMALSGHEIPEVSVKSRKKHSNPAIATENLNAMRAMLGMRPQQGAVTC